MKEWALKYRLWLIPLFFSLCVHGYVLLLNDGLIGEKHASLKQIDDIAISLTPQEPTNREPQKPPTEQKRAAAIPKVEPVAKPKPPVVKKQAKNEAEEKPAPAKPTLKAPPSMAKREVIAPKSPEKQMIVKRFESSLPSETLSEASKGEEQNYRKTLLGWLQAHRDYPDSAKRQKIEGTTVLYFSVSRDGNINAYAIAASSGHPVLDQATLQMLERAAPFPKAPESFKKANIQITIPVAYELTESEQ